MALFVAGTSNFSGSKWRPAQSDQEPPPDGWFDLLKGDFKLGNVLVEHGGQ
jgi:hypothetical protein